jgi:hypothetical protein
MSSDRRDEMKKITGKKLNLRSETVAVLASARLEAVRGGNVPVTNFCSNGCSNTGDCDPPKPGVRTTTTDRTQSGDYDC